MRDEFIFGTRDAAELVAKRKRWRSAGRASWIKPDGTYVHLVTFPEQLEAMDRDERVYIVGTLDAKCLRLLKRHGVVVVRT
jgi:hypothetical protein